MKSKNNEIGLPYLPFDSEEIRLMRTQVQKKWENESFWPWLFLRRFSIYITRFIIKYTNFTPNQITIIGIFFGVISGSLFLLNNPTYQILGIIFYQLTYLADCVDGEVARLKKSTSTIGHWLDSGLRYTLYSAFFALMYTNLFSHSQRYLPILIYLLFTFSLISIWTTDNERVSSVSKDVTSGVKKRNLFNDFIIFSFATDPGMYLIYFVLILFQSIHLQKLWLIYHLVIFMLKVSYRLYMVLLAMYREEDKK